jgi:hypothetical protein
MKSLMPIAVALAIAGCVDTPLADADFGKSVAQMVEAQTYDLNASRNPPALAPESGDGARLKNALDEYRKDVANGEEVKQPIVFEVGNGQ